jgi:DNA-binding protein HU-beta
MTKAEVIAKLAKKTGIDKLDIQVVVESLFQLIQSAMLEGDSIQFKGFGKFVNKKRGKKLARNLSNNTAILIEEHYVPTLKPSKAFINQVKESVKMKN